MCSHIWFDKVFFFFESQFGLISITKESINQINIQLCLHLNINKFTIKDIKIKSNSKRQNPPRTL